MSEQEVKIVYKERVGPSAGWATFTMVFACTGLVFGLWLGRQIEPTISIDSKRCQSIPTQQATHPTGLYQLKLADGYTAFLCHGEYQELVPDPKPLVEAMKDQLSTSK